MLAKARAAYERDLQNTAGLTRDIAAKLAADDSAMNRSLAADLSDGDSPGWSGSPGGIGEGGVLKRLLSGGGFSAALKKAEARLDEEVAGGTPCENGPDVDAARQILGQLLQALRVIAERNARLDGDGTFENPYVLTSDAPLLVAGPCTLGVPDTRPDTIALWPNEHRLYLVPKPTSNP